MRTADGEFYEVHEPLSDHDRWLLVQHDTYRPLQLDSQVDENGVAKPGARAERVRAKMSRFFFEERVEPVTPAEVAAAHHHGGEHEAIEASRRAARPHPGRRWRSRRVTDASVS